MNETIEMNYELDFSILLKGAIEIGNSLDGKQNPIETKNLIYAEGLGQKVIHHALSAQHLFNGFQLASDKHLYKPQIDFASMAILTRAALETYLTLNYLFVSSTDKDELHFKFLSWDLAGFLERKDHIPMSQEHKDKQAKEKVLLEKVILEIQETNTFKNLNSKRKKLVLDGHWRIDNSWGQLAINAGFGKSFFSQQYKFLCAYAHSSRLSVIQIQQTKELNHQREMGLASISVLMVILAKFMYDYMNLIPELHEFGKTTKYYPVIMFWKMAGENLQ